MGYTNDIRVLLPEKEFNALDEKLRATEGFCGYDVKSFRSEYPDTVKRFSPEREPVKFVYFGWDCINWSDYNELVDAVEAAVDESEHYHFMRIGEDYSDIEERYGLGDVWIDSISISRHFDDEDTEVPQ